jgi:hypothetical protein
MAWAVVTFCNALGTKLYYSKFEPIDDGSFRYNSIDPIGTPPPINNVWTEPFRNDCRSGYFYYHAFAQNNINEVWSVWDATLKYDMDSDPDNVINSNPGCGTMTSGHSWVLPCNVLELTYIQHLVDDWCKDQGESHIWDCGSDRLGCGQFYRAIEFVIYDNN